MSKTSAVSPRKAARGLRTTRTAGGSPKSTAQRYAFIGPAELQGLLDRLVAAGVGKNHSDVLRRLIVGFASHGLHGDPVRLSDLA